MRKFLWLSLFAVGFAYMESATVVYLRTISGRLMDIFPMEILDPHIGMIEIGRELVTLLILVMVAIIAENSFVRRFYVFLFVFGLWDIFYYFWLKVFIGWPRSLLDADILFLIPLPWIGPVIAPLLVAFILCFSGGIAIVRNRNFSITTKDAVLFLSGSLILIFNFILPSLKEIKEFGMEGLKYINPFPFNWFLYFPGLLFIALGLLRPVMFYQDNK